jgi:tetratricopeptide (TPR) repeat protein
MIKTRFIINSIDVSCLEKDHFDLLYFSRNLWKRRLESCKLGNIEKNILGFTRKDIEVPGYLAPIIYKNYLHSGNPTELVNVIYHNEQDVVSLIALLLYINQITDPNNIHQMINHTDNISIARLYSKNSDLKNAELFYRRILCLKDESAATKDIMFEFGWFLRKAGKYNDALELWKTASDLNHVPSMIQMAKHFEHFEKDLKKALYLTNKVLDLYKIKQDSEYKCSDDVEKRKHRLNEKLRKFNGK